MKNAKVYITLTIIISIFSIVMIQGCFDDFVIPIGKDDFLANLTTNKKYYKIGEPVELTLVLQNITSKSQDLSFNSGQSYDFIVKELPSEKEIWRWSNDKVFTLAIWTMILDPWERKTYTFEWDQKDNESKQLVPGTYKIEAIITSNPQIFAASKKIVIEDSKSETEFETIDKGTQSGYQKRASIIIKDKDRWEEIWNLHSSNLDQIPHIPEIDFSKDMVIAIFRGEFPSSGFSTEVSSINEKDGRLEVVVTETDDIKGMVLDVITYPFHIIKIQKTDLPIEFEYRRVINVSV